jgi:NADH-quinone oxidoreductase subunit J
MCGSTTRCQWPLLHSDFGFRNSFGFWISGFGFLTTTMGATDILFYIFSAFALICGAMLLLSRNPVNSAMFLVLTIGSLAGLFVLLEAFFLAAIQILVYAGAVMVLFLFVIMLLDLKAEERRRFKVLALIGGAVAVGTMLAIFFKSLGSAELSARAAAPGFNAGTIELGKLLFSQYLLPFEIVSVLLLVAMVGVVLLSKKDLK